MHTEQFHDGAGRTISRIPPVETLAWGVYVSGERRVPVLAPKSEHEVEGIFQWLQRNPAIFMSPEPVHAQYESLHFCIFRKYNLNHTWNFVVKFDLKHSETKTKDSEQQRLLGVVKGIAAKYR